MAHEALIREVAEALGSADSQDQPIDPEGHRALLKDTAPSLAHALAGTALAAAATRQGEAEVVAQAAQKRFKENSNRAAWLVVLAATASATIMVAGGLAPDSAGEATGEGYWRALNILLAVLGFGFAAAATALIRVTQGEKLLERWMENRAKAETSRLDYFWRVVNQAPGESEDPVRARLERLEYFRRYQLEGQANYYRDAGERHERAARRTITWSAMAIAAAGLANATAGMLGAWKPEWAAIAALGVIAQSVGSKLTNDEAIGQDSRNAERYRRTRDALVGLSGRLDEVRESIAAGNEKTLPAFVEAVHEHLSVEHRQWIASQDAVDAAVKRLVEQLDTAKKELSGDDA